MSTPHAAETTPRDQRAIRSALAEIERVASVLRRQLQAAEDRAKRESRIAEQFAALKEAGRAALALERDGIEAATAVARIARARALPPASVAYWRDQARRARGAAGRAQRDREIVRLAALGRSNAEVARACGVSVRTVTRVIAARFRS